MDTIWKHRNKYEILRADLEALETATGAYLSDFNVDEQNVLEDKSILRGSADYWIAMYQAACIAAGSRAESAGMDINNILGRVIY